MLLPFSKQLQLTILIANDYEWQPIINTPSALHIIYKYEHFLGGNSYQDRFTSLMV